MLGLEEGRQELEVHNPGNQGAFKYVVEGTLGDIQPRATETGLKHTNSSLPAYHSLLLITPLGQSLQLTQFLYQLVKTRRVKTGSEGKQMRFKNILLISGVNIKHILLISKAVFSKFLFGVSSSIIFLSTVFYSCFK